VPPPSTILNTLLQAASGDTLYEPEVPGGHTRSDGIDIKWEVRWVEKKGTSQLSLFCCDMIRRGSLRVRRPLSSKSHLTERICQLGVDLVRINHSTPRGHRTIASARPEHICGRLFRAQRDIGRGTDRGGAHLWLLDLLPGDVTASPSGFEVSPPIPAV
jgi:hypothetical protein